MRKPGGRPGGPGLREKRTILALLWSAFFVAYLDRTNISIAGPTMMRALALSPQQFGFVLAAFTAGYALLQIPGGALADRFGVKPMLIVALVAWSAFTGLTSLAGSLGLLVAVRFFFGVGEGLESGAHFKALGDTFSSRERASASGLFHTALALGPALGAPVAAAMIARFGWQAVFLSFTIPGCLVALAVWRWFPQPAQAVASLATRAVARDRPVSLPFAKRPAAWAAFGTYFFFNVAFWGLLNWMPAYLSLARHIDLRALGLVATIPYVCGFAGLIALGSLARRRSYAYRPALIAVSYLLACGGLALAFFAPGVIACVLGLSFAAFFLYGGFGPFWALVLDFVPAGTRGVFGGYVNFGGQLGGFLSPLAVGALLQATGSFAGCFFMMIGALVIAAATLLGVPRLPRNRSEAATPADA